MPDASRTRNLATVEAAFAAVGSADAQRQLDNYTDDLVMEMPYTDPPTRIEGKAAALAALSHAFMTFKMQLTITAVHDCVDPDELIVEFTSNGHVTTTGNSYLNTYISVMRFRDGKISFQREFFNPLIALQAATPAG